MDHIKHLKTGKVETTRDEIIATRDIFKRGGQKREISHVENSDNRLDDELDAKLDLLHSAWAATPATLGKNLAVAEWRSDVQLAEVVIEKGKFLGSMGFTQGNKLWLHIEEALFLMETTRMLVTHNNEELSVQQLYAIMDATGFSRPEYLVYSYLRRLGYIVKRHRAKWVAANTAKLNKMKKDKREREHDEDDSFRPHNKCFCTGCMDAKPAVQALPLASTPRGGFNNQEPSKRARTEEIAAPVEQAEAMARVLESEREGERKGGEDVDMASDEMRSSVMEKHPYGVSAFASSLEELESKGVDCQPQVPSTRPVGNPSAKEDDCFNSQVMKSKSWWPPHMLSKSTHQLDNTATSTAATNTTAVTTTTSQPLTLPQEKASLRTETANFDVYQPNTEFSRRVPDRVLFRLAITGQRTPDFTDVLKFDLNDQIPIKFCIVNEGVINIFSFNVVKL